MQNVSQTYLSILQDEDHWYEHKVSINGVEYGTDELRSVATKHEMFQNEPEIGKAVSGEIDITINAPSVEIPKMATVIPYTRICNENEQSEWIQQGVYFIDTRQRTKSDASTSVLTIHGFDAMLKAEQPFVSATITGDSVDTAMVAEIASIMGVTVDPRTYTLMNMSYTIPLPTGYSCREVLGYIASAYAGCFIMSDTGQLRLVTITELPPETNYLIDNDGDAITFGGDRILV